MRKYIILITALILFTNCEDVIDVELNETEPKLVIDASLNWFKGTLGNDQVIKLSLTAPFFDEILVPANGAEVKITDTASNTFIFIEDGLSGVYKNSDFIPVLNNQYNLIVSYDNETYTATETLKSVTPIDFIEQKNDGGFSGEDIELKAFYTDPEDEENYYLFKFISSIPVIPALEVYEDRFTNGNQIFGFYTEEDLEIGDEVTIRNYGISKRFYEFMFILLQQGSVEGGGPFETQPATVRGNCINETNQDNFPFGYFRLSEADELIYTIQ